MLYAYPLSSYHIIFSKANSIRVIINSFVRKSIPLFSKSNLIKLHLTDPEIMSYLHRRFRVPNHTVPKSVIPLEKNNIQAHLLSRQSPSKPLWTTINQTWRSRTDAEPSRGQFGNWSEWWLHSPLAKLRHPGCDGTTVHLIPRDPHFPRLNSVWFRSVWPPFIALGIIRD